MSEFILKANKYKGHNREGTHHYLTGDINFRSPHIFFAHEMTQRWYMLFALDATSSNYWRS